MKLYLKISLVLMGLLIPLLVNAGELTKASAKRSTCVEVLRIEPSKSNSALHGCALKIIDREDDVSVVPNKSWFKKFVEIFSAPKIPYVEATQFAQELNQLRSNKAKTKALSKSIDAGLLPELTLSEAVFVLSQFDVIGPKQLKVVKKLFDLTFAKISHYDLDKQIQLIQVMQELPFVSELDRTQFMSDNFQIEGNVNPLELVNAILQFPEDQRLRALDTAMSMSNGTKELLLPDLIRILNPFRKRDERTAAFRTLKQGYVVKATNDSISFSHVLYFCKALSVAMLRDIFKTSFVVSKKDLLDLKNEQKEDLKKILVLSQDLKIFDFDVRFTTPEEMLELATTGEGLDLVLAVQLLKLDFQKTQSSDFSAKTVRVLATKDSVPEKALKMMEDVNTSFVEAEKRIALAKARPAPRQGYRRANVARKADATPSYARFLPSTTPYRNDDSSFFGDFTVQWLILNQTPSDADTQHHNQGHDHSHHYGNVTSSGDSIDSTMSDFLGGSDMVDGGSHGTYDHGSSHSSGSHDYGSSHNHSSHDYSSSHSLHDYSSSHSSHDYSSSHSSSDYGSSSSSYDSGSSGSFDSGGGGSSGGDF